MAYCDDDLEDLPEVITNYYFEDDEEPISFSVLPITWTNSEIIESGQKHVYVHGDTDGGLRKFFKQVNAWKFDLSEEKPQISVLSKDKNWIKLQKPRKSYEETIRTVLITVHFLHLLKKNPELSEKIIWDKLSQIFSSYDNRPVLSDLVDHKAVIEEAVKRDKSLRKSKYVMAFLEDKLPLDKRSCEGALTKERKFIVDDNGSGEEDSSSDEEEDSSCEEEGDSYSDLGGSDKEEAGDSVCCICDNGGTLLFCEGICMRSFHPTRKAAKKAAETRESQCVSLGLSEEEVKRIPIFKCKNCLYKQHQCFACGNLGSSDESSGAEVIQCANTNCGYFYHPCCVAKLLNQDNDAAAEELSNRILAGESFTCPLHICIVCKKPEDKTVFNLQMAVCRHCPTAYHRKCLPREIAFQGITQRAWEDLLVDRILIYCLKHEICNDLKTPERNHIKFPDVEEREEKSSAIMLKKDNVLSKRKMPFVRETYQIKTARSKKRTVVDCHPDERNHRKLSKQKGAGTLRKIPNVRKSCFAETTKSSRTAEDEASLGDKLHELFCRQLDSEELSKSYNVCGGKLTKTSKPCSKKLDPTLDYDSERRIVNIMKEASSNIRLQDIIKKYDKIHSCAYKMDSNKSIMPGKVEGFCESIQAAVRKLDEGGSIEDAKAICEPQVLNMVDKWKDKLHVYLSPFLLGMRYTSFGRHFLKVEKLQEIVDRIHHYVNDGDTIVDFCCGANNFSCLMEEKLEQMDKNCYYKNYDLLPTKNDFNLEIRDWFTVKRDELPLNSELIMGLNPPFGVKGQLANMFFDKALEFKPKLLILVAPPEAERLDKKKVPYDLIWEDNKILAGKSFYLPGSIDVNDEQIEDWNTVPPVLYLWSRPDWTARHKAIAEKAGQLRGERESAPVNESFCDDQDDGNGFTMEVDQSLSESHPPEGQKGNAADRKADPDLQLVGDDSVGRKHATDYSWDGGIMFGQYSKKTNDPKIQSVCNKIEGESHANVLVVKRAWENQEFREAETDDDPKIQSAFCDHKGKRPASYTQGSMKQIQSLRESGKFMSRFAHSDHEGKNNASDASVSTRGNLVSRKNDEPNNQSAYGCREGIKKASDNSARINQDSCTNHNPKNCIARDDFEGTKRACDTLGRSRANQDSSKYDNRKYCIACYYHQGKENTSDTSRSSSSKQHQDSRKTDGSIQTTCNDNDGTQSINFTPGNSSRGNQDPTRWKSREVGSSREAVIENLMNHTWHRIHRYSSRDSPSHGVPHHVFRHSRNQRYSRGRYPPHHYFRNTRGRRFSFKYTKDQKLLPNLYSTRQQCSPSKYNRGGYRNQASYPGNRSNDYYRGVDDFASREERLLDHQSYHDPRNLAENGVHSMREDAGDDSYKQYQSRRGTVGCEGLTFWPESRYESTTLNEQ